MSFYRFVSNNIGIYEAVDKYCPRDGDNRRKLKPDGSWLPRVGKSYPGSVSFWKPYGLKKYLNSGLQEWHRSVVEESLFVEVCSEMKDVDYEDDYQVICKPIQNVDTIPWNEFPKLTNFPVVQKVVAYITIQNSNSILVFEHDEEFADAGLQVASGTVENSESSDKAIVREVFEETGLSNFENIELIDSYLMFKHWTQVFNQRFVYKLVCETRPPETWTHAVQSQGKDKGMNFHYRWLDWRDAEGLLNVSLGSSLRKIFS